MNRITVAQRRMNSCIGGEQYDADLGLYYLLRQILQFTLRPRRAVFEDASSELLPLSAHHPAGLPTRQRPFDIGDPAARGKQYQLSH
jgi:hypothetical protein